MRRASGAFARQLVVDQCFQPNRDDVFEVAVDLNLVGIGFGIWSAQQDARVGLNLRSRAVVGLHGDRLERRPSEFVRQRKSIWQVSFEFGDAAVDLG